MEGGRRSATLVAGGRRAATGSDSTPIERLRIAGTARRCGPGVGVPIDPSDSLALCGRNHIPIQDVVNDDRISLWEFSAAAPKVTRMPRRRIS